MKEKELIEFMHSLWNRGLISVSPDEFDYEWVVWDYLKLRQPPVISSFVCGHPPKQTYLIDGTWHCEQCGGKWESIANK